MKIKCVKCGEKNDVTLHREYLSKSKSRPKWIGRLRTYKDEFGRKSSGNVCHECLRKRERKISGHTHPSESKFPKLIKARAAEGRAAEFFKSLGFLVIRHGYTGPDLFCDLGGMRWTVEVKPARLVQPIKYPHGSYVVDLVHKNRRSDDLVAYVLPNGRIYIEAMEMHLKACPKSGARSITKIVREFGLKESA